MIKFGTGGWRAVIGDEFTRANIQILAEALSRKMQDEGVADQGLCIGYDRRFLSKESVKWACETLAANGIRSWFVNKSSPTPLIMYYVMAHDLPYGMMVTASHNPAIYNQGVHKRGQGRRSGADPGNRKLHPERGSRHRCWQSSSPHGLRGSEKCRVGCGI